MQMTVDIPEKLAEQLGTEPDRVAQIIARGLHRGWSGISNLRREVISFLAGQPTAAQIIAFRPSQAAATRMSELLQRSSKNALTPEEEAELEDMCEADRFVSLIKTEVLVQSSGKA